MSSSSSSSSNPRKLSAFRQLSLHCDTTPEFTLKASRTRDRPPHPIRIAWADTSLPASPKEEGVIARKCVKEVKKPARLTRHSSLEKDSILYTKQELTERLRNALNKEKEPGKPNLNIFLGTDLQHQHQHQFCDDFGYEDVDGEEISPRMSSPAPKIIQNLVEAPSNVFQIRKSRDLASYTASSCSSSKSNAIVVVPVVEKKDSCTTSPPVSDRSCKETNPKAIKNVIIRPATAAAKRERFQKRTNSAFNSACKEATPSNSHNSVVFSRPPLVRSSSAPTKPQMDNKPKFLATKRKIKSGKKREFKASSSPGEDAEDSGFKNRHVYVNGSEIVTMVSLVSPAASDTEEPEAEKPKTSPKKESKEETPAAHATPKNLSLRKTVKSVSFQQSSIHAIRSFSASFPGRRSSMATALMLNSHKNNTSKNQEKRFSTNSSSVDEDGERVAPKRRLVRSATDQSRKSVGDETNAVKKSTEEEEEDPDGGNNDIKVNITSKTSFRETVQLVQAKKNTAIDDVASSSARISVEEVRKIEENVEGEEVKEAASSNVEEEVEEDDGEVKFGSVKEKQCWEMFCKMSNKGLKVSYDTILRGMLTPTEYRMRRKESEVSAIIPEEAKELN